MNSPEHCIDICLQAGFPYAGVQYASECFCGEDVPSTTQKIADTSCNMKCPGNPKELCGGYFTMNVYETGVSKFNANVPNLIPENSSDSVRIVFLLTLNGRALRQVRRLINALYHTKHYFYIHVDARQDYLHRELLPLQEQFSNVKIAHKRFSTIWGGASLLEMLLSAMRNLFALQWKWDFVINLSESDFPIKPLKQLETFLTANKGRNFVKSHGREVQRFIKKQGLDKTFIECDAHMWRIGDRKLPRGIVIDGGSDWIALSPDFVSYVVGEQDELLVGLHTIFKHTLLPAESFFHTVLRNSMFCSSYVDNNLHVTNWKRKLGCKCQYKHVVDWCGCSPNDFRLDDWSRIQSTRDRQLFFARKFEPVINQAIIARVEQWLGFDDHYDLPNSEAYWQSIYHKNDSNPPVDDALLTHTTSITRLNAKILTQERCKIVPGEVIEISSYHYEDMYKGNLIKHNVEVHGYERVLIETWYKPKRHLELNRYSRFYDNIKIFLVSSDYDQKEQTFRNFANILGPLSEPSVLYQFILTPDQTTVTNNFTIFWLDPADNIAEINDLQIDDSNLTSYIKPNLQTPLLPGIWKVAMFDSGMLVAQTKFLITPLQYLSGNKIVDHEVTFVNAGSMSSYKDYSTRYRDITDLTKSESHRESARMLVQSNMKRFGSDLVEWIDNLVHQFYDVLGSCVHYENEELYNTVLSCGRHNFEICKLTKWSSFAPDPKGHIGELNKVTGLLDRR